MNRGPEPLDAPENPPPMFGKVILVLFAVFFAFLFLGVAAPNVQILHLLILGWLKFLSRTIPKISWNWDLVGMALLCLAALLGLTHGFLRWLIAQIGMSRGKAWFWPWRFTWCGTLSTGVLFLVGMASGGIVHQAGWIASSPESLYERKGGIDYMFELRQFHLDLIMAMNDCNSDLQETRRDLEESQRRQRHLSKRSRDAERFTCLVIVDSSRRIVGAIISHRVRSGPASSRDVLYWNGSVEEWLALSELPALIRKHDGQLVAL
jgi:hypothetical protein